MTLPWVLLIMLALMGCKGEAKREAERDRQVRNCWTLGGGDHEAVQQCLVARYDWDTDSTLSPVVDREIEQRRRDSGLAPKGSPE